MYAINGTVTTTKDGFDTTIQIPTFYLHPSVQGIVSKEHAEKIALSIVNPLKNENLRVSLWASLIELD